MSATNQRRTFAYVPEVTYGTTPGTPSTNAFEVNGYAATYQPDQLNSNNITAHRQVTFSRRGNTGASGTMSVELCPDNYDWVLENLFRNTFATNVLKPGNSLTSVSIEEAFPDVEAGAQYQVASGVRFDTMSLKVTPDSLVIAEFTFMASSVTALSGTSIDASPTPVTVKNSFFHEGGTFNEGGSAVGLISSVTIDVKNNMSGNRALGNSGYRSLSDGKFEVTGEVTGYFESNILYNKFRNSTSSSLDFTFAAGAETLKFEMSNLVYTGGDFDRGTDGPVTVTLQFTAIYDVSDAASIVITRA